MIPHRLTSFDGPIMGERARWISDMGLQSENVSEFDANGRAPQCSVLHVLVSGNGIDQQY